MVRLLCANTGCPSRDSLLSTQVSLQPRYGFFSLYPKLTSNPFSLIALHQFRSSPSSSTVNFTTKFLPYQLYPSAPQAGESKYDWYKKTKYDNSEERMKMYTTLMSAYGVPLNIDFRFDGLVANTLQAHRVVQHYQEERGAQVADKIVNCMSETVLPVLARGLIDVRSVVQTVLRASTTSVLTGDVAESHDGGGDRRGGGKAVHRL